MLLQKLADEMLLHKLLENAGTLGLPPRLYENVAVRYVIELDRRGELLNPCPTDTADPKNPRTRRGTRRPVPQVQRSSATRPHLFADSADYTFGLSVDPVRERRTETRHRAYMDLVERCAAGTEEPAIAAVRDFLRADPVSALELDQDFDPAARITFRVDGQFVVDLPGVQDFWASANEPQDAPQMECIVCGKVRPVLQRLQTKIKGVPGGQTAGTSIISANEKAFLSYGLEDSLIAPTCSRCGERFSKALNELLASEKNSIRVGNAAFVFWTVEDTAFDLSSLLHDPQPEHVKTLIESARRGQPSAPVDPTRFYAATLTASQGRAVVRDWLDTTVGNVQQNMARWFDMQRVVGERGEDSRLLRLRDLANATIRPRGGDGRRDHDLPPSTPRALLRTALAGSPLPLDLLMQAVRRNRAEQTVTRPRAALIKLVILSREGKEDDMVELNVDHPSAGYHCGRLLAVLEEVQRAAIPGAGTTIIDRFFGSASSSPSLVFGPLLRGAQPHLAKLERDRPGFFHALQQRLEDVQSRIAEFPNSLSLRDQGLFALGYYHQRAFDRARMREASEKRDAVVPAVADAEQTQG